MPEKRSRTRFPNMVVWEAYQTVKANHGAAGVDGQSIEEFEENLKNNLYKIWNRMSSGSYFPAAGTGVEIPKARTEACGRWAFRRSLTAWRRWSSRYLEPLVEPHFPSGLVRVSARQVGTGCGSRGEAAVLAA